VVIGDAIAAPNARLAFIRALAWLRAEVGFVANDAEPKLEKGVVVGQNTVLGRGVCVGTNSRIGHNVTIADGVRIGANCVIKSGATIGEDGFGFERDENGRPLRFPHLGAVVIGDRVEVGSHAVICRGALGDTTIGDDVKIDDGAQIAHNCRIGRSTLIHAHAALSGSVVIGENAWIGPGATIIQQIEIGDGALVGIGANVVRPVAAGTTVAGNPARPLRKR
jgi:UDP-3-O-[3-hydroxymyristoyl] glucosamine N-acyltransferase LpxD